MRHTNHIGMFLAVIAAARSCMLADITTSLALIPHLRDRNTNGNSLGQDRKE